VTPGQKSSKPAELLDIYPTLIELCGLPSLEHLEGVSLLPQLRDADAPRERPAITSHNQSNFSIVTDRWRYIRYVDGAEELYDIVNDPHEWDNVAAKNEDVVKTLRGWLPKNNVGPVAGSRARILTYYDRVPVWEGQVIGKDDPIPQDSVDYRD
jgi:arylsulfatase A-like enzyme